MGNRCRMTATSGKEKDPRFMIPHSKNGRCISLAQVGEVGGAEQSHVEQKWVGSGGGHGDHKVIILGSFGMLCSCISISKGCINRDVASAYLLNLSYPFLDTSCFDHPPQSSHTLWQDPALL